MVLAQLPRTPDFIIEFNAYNIGWGAHQGEIWAGDSNLGQSPQTT